MTELCIPSNNPLVDILSPAMLNEANKKNLIPRSEHSQKTTLQVLYIYELISIKSISTKTKN